MRLVCTWSASVFVVLAAAGIASAQGDRVHLLSRVNQYDGMGSGGFDYNDVLGYRASDGTEVALLGTWNGTSFIDTTDPFNPVELKFITHSSSLWSDMAVWKDYVYVVTDQSAGGGLQIIDVSDLTNIQVVGSYTGFNTSHSLFIDQTKGHIYCCGTDVGLVILDLANPTAPTLITTYTAHYVHEVTVQNGLAHFSEIYNGQYRTVDVSNLPTLTTLDVVTTPSAFAHSSTVNETDTLVGLTDEVVSAKFVLYDVSDPTNIVQRSTFIENPAGIIHNVVQRDGIVQLSAYAEGYVALDVSDPDHPIRLGSYDTWPGASGNYNGAWGVYQQPSGTVYISNIEDGLWVLCRATRIQHAGLPDTLDSNGPYAVTAIITPSSAGGGVTSATVEYSTNDDATTTTVAMAPTGNPNEWSASIPGQSRGTTVQYRLHATDALGTSTEPENRDGHFVFGVGKRRSFYAENFDGGTDGGWTHGMVTGTDDWERGIPARKRVDPYRTTSGTKCFGNDLGNGGSDGVYADNSDNWLESPSVDLTNQHGVRLRFQRWLRVEDAARDLARVLVNGVEVWRNPTNGGTRPTLDDEWGLIDFDVSAAADDVAATKVRFELKSDGSVAKGGWNVDDVELYAVSTVRDPESYGTGAAGSGGFVPTLSTVGDPMIGGPPFTLAGANLLGGAPSLVLVGFSRAQIPYKGLDLLVDPVPPTLLVPITASGPAGVAGAGAFSLSASLPDDPALDGLEIDTQVIVFDAGAANHLASSAGLAFWIGQ
jgi:choice-of-anchor B domain-containing protein